MHRYIMEVNSLQVIIVRLVPKGQILKLIEQILHPLVSSN